MTQPTSPPLWVAGEFEDEPTVIVPATFLDEPVEPTPSARAQPPTRPTPSATYAERIVDAYDHMRRGRR